MSAYDVQRATALLIRRPEAFRGDELGAFLSTFTLTEPEASQVRAMASDRRVTKFGFIMGSSRERKVIALLPLSRQYLPEGLLKKIWAEHFEPAAIETHFNQLPTTFLQFLLENEAAKDLLQAEAPPFVKDMLLFESAQGQFRMKIFSTPRKVPDGSRLVHADFILLDLDYDIQGLRARLSKEKDKQFEPEKRAVKLLFVRRGTSWECRVFEIDEEVKKFLEAELRGEQPTLISGYPTLVKIGICKEIAPC